MLTISSSQDLNNVENNVGGSEKTETKEETDIPDKSMVAGKAIENPKELGEKTETQAKGEGRHNKKCFFSGRTTKTPLKPPKPHR